MLHRMLFICATHTAGQTCFQMKRLYVHEKVYDVILDETIALARKAKVGDPADPEVTIGPVQNKQQHQRLL